MTPYFMNILKAALINDTEKVKVYAELFITNYRESKDSKNQRAIRQIECILYGKNCGDKVVLD